MDPIAKKMAEEGAKIIMEAFARALTLPGSRTKARPAKTPKKKCSKRSCSEPSRSKGLCANHYQQARRAAKSNG